MKANFWKNYLYNTIYQILVLILPLFTTPYVSRVLGAGAIGVYSYSTSIVSYFVLFAGLGTNLYGIREIAYHQHDPKLRTQRLLEIQGLKLATTGIMGVVYGAVIWMQEEYRLIFLLQGIQLISQFLDISWFFQGLENFKLTATRSMAIRLLGVVAILFLVRSPDDFMLYVGINVAAGLLGNLSLWLFVPKYLEKPDWKTIRPFSGIKTVLELFVPLIAIQVYTILDKTMLGAMAFGQMEESGYYEQASKIIAMCMTLITSVGTTLAPRMAAEVAQGKSDGIRKSLFQSYDLVMLLACPICMGVIGVSDIFVPWFFGEGYEKVSMLMKMKAMLFLIIPFSNIAGHAVLNPTKQHTKGTKAVITGAVVNLMLNAVLIPQYMAVGAILSTVVAEIVVTVLHFYYIRQYVNMKEILRWLARYLLAGCIMSVVVALVGNMLLQVGVADYLITFIQILVGIIIYGLIALFVLRSEPLVQGMNTLRAKFGKGKGV